VNGPGRCADLEIRTLQDEDRERLIRLFERLSPETVYRRFFTRFPGLPAAVLRYLANTDHDDHERLAVLCGDDIVAIASWDRAAHADEAAEIAILVEDAWQHQGVGRDLMRTLTAGAVDHGITTLTATVLTENEPARRLARSLARPERVELDGPETHFTFRLANRPHDSSRAAVVYPGGNRPDAPTEGWLSHATFTSRQERSQAGRPAGGARAVRTPAA